MSSPHGAIVSHDVSQDLTLSQMQFNLEQSEWPPLHSSNENNTESPTYSSPTKSSGFFVHKELNTHIEQFKTKLSLYIDIIQDLQ